MRRKNSMAVLLALATTCSLLMLAGCKGSKEEPKVSAVASNEAMASGDVIKATQEEETSTPEVTKEAESTTQPTNAAETKSTYKAGTVTATDYKSEYLGLEFKANDKYHLATKEQMEKVFGIGAKVVYGESNSTAVELAKDMLNYEMLATTSTGMPNVNIAVQPSIIPGMEVNDYFDAMKKQLENVKTMKVTVGEPKEEEFCGEKYLVAPAELPVGTGVATEKFYLRKKDDNFILITVCGQKGAEKERDLILKNFKQVK